MKTSLITPSTTLTFLASDCVRKYSEGQVSFERSGPGSTKPVYCGTADPTVNVSSGELPYRDCTVTWNNPPDHHPARAVSMFSDSCVFCANALPVFRPPDVTF